MKKLLVLSVAAFMALFIYSEEIRKEFNVKFGQKLTVDLELGGNITVTGWDKDSVSVEAVKDGRDAENCIVNIEQSGSGVNVEAYLDSKSRNSKCDVDVTIMVPLEFDLNVKTMGGIIELSGIKGEFEGETMGGELKLSSLEGKIDLSTMGGAISVKDSDLDGKVSTMGGGVTVDNVTGGLDASTMGGAVVYKNVTDRFGNSKGKTVKISTMGGAIKVDDAPMGADVKTMGGAIHVKSAGEFVKATTMGGDITIDEVAGWVKAATMGGDIDVAMVGDPEAGERNVELSSKGGDITLIVPDGLSMDVELKLVYSNDKKGRYEIISDFGLEENLDEGKRNSTLTAEGKINGGKHKIFISTIAGNITLKKGK